MVIYVLIFAYCIGDVNKISKAFIPVFVSKFRGYDVIMFIHNEFGILLSSGTVYSVIYSMERNGLVSGMWRKRKRVYKLTNKGEKAIKNMLNSIGEIQNTVKLVIGSELRTSRSPSP